MAEQYGLDIAEACTSLANNPAAIGAGENEGGEDERKIIQLIKPKRT